MLAHALVQVGLGVVGGVRGVVVGVVGGGGAGVVVGGVAPARAEAAALGLDRRLVRLEVAGCQVKARDVLEALEGELF